MSRLYNILNQLVGSKETLATGATLIRSGKNRKLILNNYTKPSGSGSGITMPSADFPTTEQQFMGFRRNSSGLGTAVGMVALYPNSQSVALYYAGTYNSAQAGLSGLATGDKISAICEWVVET